MHQMDKLTLKTNELALALVKKSAAPNIPDYNNGIQ
jgi:hypothetical protein